MTNKCHFNFFLYYIGHWHLYKYIWNLMFISVFLRSSKAFLMAVSISKHVICFTSCVFHPKIVLVSNLCGFLYYEPFCYSIVVHKYHDQNWSRISSNNEHHCQSLCRYLLPVPMPWLDVEDGPWLLIIQRDALADSPCHSLLGVDNRPVLQSCRPQKLHPHY